MRIFAIALVVAPAVAVLFLFLLTLALRRVGLRDVAVERVLAVQLVLTITYAVLAIGWPDTAGWVTPALIGSVVLLGVGLFTIRLVRLKRARKGPR